MKQNRVIGIIFTVFNIILIVVCAVFYFKTDRTAPKFDVHAADITYISGMDQSRLLEGISAYDAVDGDVTSRIVIEKIIVNNEEQKIVVFYAVSDQAGNVAKFSKVFPAMLSAEEIDSLGTAGYVEDLEVTNLSQVTTPIDNETPTPSPSTSFSPAPTPEPTATPSPTPTPEPTPDASPQEVQAPPAAPAVDESAPVLSLKMGEVKTAVGVAPAWVDIIQTLRDDEDSYETLFNNLSVSKYDVNKAGTYHVTLVTEDSDGNKSQTVPCTIIVQ